MPIDEPAWERIDYDTEGLRDRVARTLVEESVDDMGYPADLSAGTTQVVFLDDTPNVNLCLRVHTLGTPEATAYAKYDCLAVQTTGSGTRPGYAVPYSTLQTLSKDLPPLPPRDLPPLPPVRATQA